MISTDKTRTHSFFSGLTLPQVEKIASLAQELEIEEGYLFFQSGDQLDYFYLIERGHVNICMEVPDSEAAGNEAQTKDYPKKYVSVANLGREDVFGWTSLVPPYFTNAAALAQTRCQVIAVDSRKLEHFFHQDWLFGYKIAIKMAQLIRERVRGLRLESING
ncbi:MAG: hypothetical protein CR997_06560 [Acidobacteria bacterium]|nr:MAG: hypothetical protein CR997_06560 [Acidobacteriota bacterium]